MLAGCGGAADPATNTSVDVGAPPAAPTDVATAAATEAPSVAAPAVVETLDDAARAARDYEAWLVDGRAREALEADRPADALAEVETFFGGPIGDPARALPLQLIAAEAARALGRHADTEMWLARAEAQLAGLGRSWEYHAAFELTLLQSRARAAQDLGRPDEAARQLALANARALELGDTRMAAALAVETANLWLAADEHALLEQHVTEALASAPFDEHADHRAALELCLATSLVVRGRLDGARDGEARELLFDLGSRAELFPSDRARTRLRLAELLLRTGDRDGAARELAAAATTLDESGDAAHFDRGLLALLEARLERARADELAADGNSAEARDVRRAALERLAATFEARLAHARGAPLLADGVGALHVGEERGLLSELVLLEAHANGAAAALARLARTHALATRHRRAGREAPTSVDAAALGLGAGEGLLVYLPAVLQSHLFLVDADGCELVAVAPVGELNRLRRAFDAAFDPRKGGALPAEQARALAAALLPPAAEARVRRWSTALVVGIELVRYAPFELLPLSDGVPLGECVALGYQPDLVTCAALAAREVAQPSADAPLVAWVGAPPVAPDLAPITLDAARRVRLGRGAAPERVLAFEGRDASAANLVEAAGSGALVLHVVTHGVPDASGRGVALALVDSDGEAVTFGVRDVEALPHVPPFVVLSACRAARGASRLGESGLEGIVGALLERGALVVLLPFEDVELDAATRLVALVQERVLAGGTSVAQALAEARRELSRADQALATASLLHAFGRANAVLVPR
jgi:hypothetical protein